MSRLIFSPGMPAGYDKCAMQKCDACSRPAVVHEVTVRGGVKKEVHLCEHHAREAGVPLPGHQAPLSQVLTQFVISQVSKGSASGASSEGAAASSPPRVSVKACPGCGLSFAQFRQVGRLGCAQCYFAFEQELAALIERAQAGGAHHCGKAPRRSGASLDRELLIQRLTRELEQAVAAEQYERAAELRDRLGGIDASRAPGGGGSPRAACPPSQAARATRRIERRET
jgi:protein arginine kinase activator